MIISYHLLIEPSMSLMNLILNDQVCNNLYHDIINLKGDTITFKRSYYDLLNVILSPSKFLYINENCIVVWATCSGQKCQ